MPANKNRIKIAKSFDSASLSYDISARLQRYSGKHILPWLPNRHDLTVVDLGCGTGFFTELIAGTYQQVIGVDISEQMLKFTQKNRSNAIVLVAGDAYRLPFQNDSVDVIYSNLVIQWCSPLEQALDEIMRVLKPGGTFVFTTLTEGTLHELKSSWAQVDNDQHVIDFKKPNQLQAMLNQGNRLLIEHQVQDVVLEYENVLHLARELKGLGANHVPLKMNKGLAGKEKWQKMTLAYRDFQEPSGIYPATYQVFSGLVAKTNA